METLLQLNCFFCIMISSFSNKKKLWFINYWLTSIADFFQENFAEKNLIEKNEDFFFTNMVYDNDDGRKPDFHFVWWRERKIKKERERQRRGTGWTRILHNLCWFWTTMWIIGMLSNRDLCVYVRKAEIDWRFLYVYFELLICLLTIWISINYNW